MLFDWLVVGQIVAMNPASSVRGPTQVVKRGKTPVLTAEQARELLDSIDISTVGRNPQLTKAPVTRNDAFRMIKRRALAAGLPGSTCRHTFRATGITAYLENGGTIEKAQQIAAHESLRTTKLYDRTSDEITLDEIERIAI